jgi:hypothetical protein
MPTPLLPPSVVGPVYTFSSQVKVLGAFQGASVQVFRNGAPIGNPAVADSTGFAICALNAGTLSLGEAITAVQTKDGVSSLPGPGTTVLDIPSKLSPPIFLSQVHTCMDAVVLGGIQIGAAVDVTSGGKRLGDALADATEITVDLVGLAALPVGAVLEATQSIRVGGQLLVSDRTHSLPAEQTPILERTLPAPQIVPPLDACDQSVLVIGIFDGMQMRLERTAGGGDIYPFSGNSIPASTLPLKEGEKVRATQFSQHCNFDSIVSNEVTVGKATSLPAPIVLGPICSGLGQIVLSNLTKGADVFLYAGRVDASLVLIGTATAAFSEQTFGIPDPLPAFSTGPTTFLVAFQTRCGIGNTTSIPTQLDQRPGSPPPPGFDQQIFECSRIVKVFCGERAIGCALQILSDDPKTPILSPSIILTQQTIDVTLFRQLLAGENITAVVTGCGAGPDARRTKGVETVLLPKPFVLLPLHTWAKAVFVGNTIEGAQVYLSINGKFAGHIEATEGSGGIQFPVSGLNPEDKVTVQQSLCTEFSEVSNPAVVTLGRMNVFQSPDPIVRGPNPQTVVVVVTDADDRHEVAGSVHLPNGVTQPTNTPFSWVFPLSQAGPAASVTAPDYVTGNVIWKLVDPAPQPPPPPASLTLELVNHVTNVILKKAEWDISHVTSLGAGPSVVDTKTGNPASSVLPQPSGSQDLYFIGCSATFEFGGKSQTVQAMVAPVIDFADKATIGWHGKPEKALFFLQVANSLNDQGQIVSVFYIQLAEVKPI